MGNHDSYSDTASLRSIRLEEIDFGNSQVREFSKCVTILAKPSYIEAID